jgi:biofilm PGA synthesis protein PgaA
VKALFPQRFLGVALGALAVALAVPGAASAQTREDAVRAARDGRYAEAIAALEQLRARGGDRRVDDDLAVVLAWAGRPADALAVFERAAPDGVAPDYVRAAMFQAYRDVGRFGDAERLARTSLAAEPASRDWSRRLALALADAGRGDEALRVLDPLLAAQADDADAWLARAYAASRTGDAFASLRAYGEARRLRPGDREAVAGIARGLRDLGGPHGAAAALPAAPLPLQAEQAAARVRWGAQVLPRDPQRRFEGTDAALVDLDRVAAAARAAGDAETLARVRRDRVLALRQRERWADALAEVDALRAEGVPIPPFVRQAEADALLALRRPREARAAYAEVVAADPLNREARIGRFFAEVEDEDFDAAFATIDALAAAEPPWKTLAHDPVPYPNSEWLDAQILAAMARNYADMQAEAWARLAPVAEGAPALGYLRSNLGQVAASRGWPRRAEEEVRIAHSLAPQDIGIEVAVADSGLRRREWPEARERIASLAARFPEDPGVRRAVRDLGAHDMFELRAEVSGRRESGSSRAAPGDGAAATARLYSPPIAERWRAIAAAGYFFAEPVEGRVTRNRAGVGAEWRAPDLTVEGIAWTNGGQVDRGGASIAANWTPNDHWSFGAEGERFAVDTPLRALYYGTTANALGASAGYAWHESRAVFLGLRGLDFSDGNRRRFARLAFAERVVDRPHLDVTLRPQLYASRNTLEGAPYFNPSRDREASLAVDVEHVLWREYEKSFGHRAVLAGGAYWQKDFGTGAIGSARYEQVWRHDPYTELRYGIEWNRRLYDGAAENAVILSVLLNQRF